MIITGSYVEDCFRKKYVSNLQSNAQKIIKNFPILDKIVNNFNEIDFKNYDSNWIFLIASWAKFDPDTQRQNEGYFQLVSKYEELLVKINFNSLSQKQQNVIISKLKSFEWSNHRGIINEFDFYLQLDNNDLIKDLVYNPVTDNDFSFKINDELYNIELSSIYRSNSSKDIKEVFERSATEIAKKMESNKLIIVRIDTATISNLNVEKAILRVVNDFNFFKGKLKIKESIRADELQLGNSCIKSVSYLEGKCKVVDVKSECVSWSEAEDIRKKSVSGQLERAIEAKLNKNQLREKKNPFLVFKFSDVAYFGYSSKLNPFSKNFAEELKAIALSCFSKTKNKDVCGIIFYENNLKDFILVSNPNLSINEEIIKKLRLIKETS